MGCANGLTPVVVPLAVPPSLLTCAAEPAPPGGQFTDADLADYVLALSDAGQDCRDRLAGVATIVGK
jgi:hypothetical protein